MRLLTKVGWALILVGAVLFLTKLLPAAGVLILLGAPMVFAGSTAEALRRARGEDES